MIVLLDRDGTITAMPPGHYVNVPEDLALLPGAGAAIARLNRAGIPVAVVTNQAGVALGHLTIETVEAIHARLDALLCAHGARVDAVACCPHAPSAGCACRKPARGMADAIARGLNHPLDAAVVVGDDRCDMGLARTIGATGLLVRTGHGARVAREGVACAAVVADLAEAVDRILQTGEDRA